MKGPGVCSAGLAGFRCGDFEGAEEAADGLVGADQEQHVGDALCPEHRVGLVVDGLLDLPLGGQLVREPPGGLLGGGQLAGHLARGQRPHDLIGQACRAGHR